MRVHSSLSVFHAFTLSRFHAFTLLLCLLSFSLTGCETGAGQDEAPASVRRQSRLGTHQFSGIAQLKFVHPLTRQIVDSPVVFLNEVEHQDLLAQDLLAQSSLQDEVRAQEVRPLEFNQLLDLLYADSYPLSGGGSTRYSSVNLATRAACAARFRGDSVFMGVYPGFSITPDWLLTSPYGRAYRRYTWTLPESASGQQHLLVVADPDQEGYQGNVLFVEPGGSEIVLEQETILGSWTFRINGEIFAQGTAPGGVENNLYAAFGSPILQTTSAGVHSVEWEYFLSGSSGEVVLDWLFQGSYLQKELVLTENLPQVTPEQTTPVTIASNFSWSDGSFLEYPEWEILGEDDAVLASGTSATIEAIWDPSESASEGENVFSEFPTAVRLKALGFRKTDFLAWNSPNSDSRDVPYEITRSFGGPSELQIVNIQLNPDRPFQNEGDSVELSADIITIGVDDVSEGDIQWQVDLLDDRGEIVIQDLATGTGFEVSAVWDGSVGGLTVENPTSYQFRITATLCGASGLLPRQTDVLSQGLSEGQCLLAWADAPMARGELEVYRAVSEEDEPLGLPLGDSTDNAQAPSNIAFSRLSKVHPVSTLTLIANDPQFEGDIPDILKVQFKGLSSGKKGEAVLAREGGGKFRGDFSLENSFTLPADVSPPKSTYAMFEPRGATAARNLIEAALEAVPDLGLAEDPTFLNWPVKRFGRFVPLKSGQPIPDDEALASGENLNSQGFDTVEVTVSSADNPGLEKPLRVVVKVPYPVSLFYSIADGDDNSLLDVWLNSTTQEKFDPQSLKDEDTKDLKTWILASCRVLDLYDLNNNKVAVEVPLAQRPKPGTEWWLKLTKPGQTQSSKLLLGYNYPTLALYVVAAMNEYGPELERLSADSSVPRDKLEIYAWLSANRKAGELFAACYAACAWDQTNYYYISISHPIQDEETVVIKDSRLVHGFFQVPLDPNGESLNIVPSSESVPAGAKKFSIPGWAEGVL